MHHRVKPFTSSDSVAVNFGTNVVAAVWTFQDVVTDQPNTKVRFIGGTEASGASTTPSITRAVGGYATGDLIVGAVGAEQTAAITADSDTTEGSWSAALTTSVGSGATGQEIITQRKVVTAAAAGQTYNVTITSTDWTAMILVFREQSSAFPFTAGVSLILNSTANVPPYVATSTIPQEVGDLIVVAVLLSGTASVPTLAGNVGPSYARVRGDSSGTTRSLTWFIATSLSFNSSEATLTATVGGAPTGCLMFAWRVRGMSVAGLDADPSIRVRTGSGGAGGTPATGGLATLVRPGSLILGAVTNSGEPGDDHTADRVYFEDADVGYSTPHGRRGVRPVRRTTLSLRCIVVGDVGWDERVGVDGVDRRDR